MSLERFTQNPWKTSHTAYEESVFNIRPAPENATAEVMIAATYRSCGFKGHPEKQVPSAGGKFLREAEKVNAPAGSRISNDTWLTVLQGALESPKRPKQSSRRFLQLCPIVPDCALYSGSARLSGNSWDPGQLLSRMVVVGSESRTAAVKLWQRLYQALSVDANDDIWARWLQAEFDIRRQLPISWTQTELLNEAAIPDLEPAKFPARQFVRDLDAILLAKPHMTRRQWISLLEALIRLAGVAHVLWLCDVNDRFWRATKAVLNGTAAPRIDEVNALIVDSNKQYLVYGQPAVSLVRNYASRYLESRLGLNLVLWNLEQHGVSIKGIDSVLSLGGFLSAVEANRPMLSEAKVVSQFDTLVDSQPSAVACKKGVGSNIVEYCRYTLGQRETVDENLRGYDQGYLLKKKADYRSAPWVVSMGPVALLALVHSCLNEVSGPRSVQRLIEHLRHYGLAVESNGVAQSDLGKNLRMLGLVLDSPDAESGMLLIPPFDASQPAAGETR